jgi:hypothetical protein
MLQPDVQHIPDSHTVSHCCGTQERMLLVHQWTQHVRKKTAWHINKS